LKRRKNGELSPLRIGRYELHILFYLLIQSIFEWEILWQTIDEMYEIVDGGVHLTFEYLAFCVVGGIIAAVGLLTDSSVTVVASMLVSPLMGPILGISFGYLIDDKRMMWKCIRNEIIGLFITFSTGFLCGAFALLSSKSQKVTTQMSSRGSAIALIAGAVVAAPSGVGVALSVANTNINSLVGVAISAALLPPIVNSGVLLVFAFHKDDINLEVKSHPFILYQLDIYSDMFSFKAKDYLYSAAGISMVLFLMNWMIIFIFSVATFLLKGITRYEMGAHKAVWDGRIFVERTVSACIRNGSIPGRPKYNDRDLRSPFLEKSFGSDPLQSPFRFGSLAQGGVSLRNPSHQPVTVSSETRESRTFRSPDSSMKAGIINQGSLVSLDSNDHLIIGSSERTSDEKQLKQ